MIYNTWQAGILNPEATRLFLSKRFTLKVKLAWWLKSRTPLFVKRLGVRLLDHTTEQLRRANR